MGEPVSPADDGDAGGRDGDGLAGRGGSALADYLAWPDAMEGFLREKRPAIIDRIAVLAETGSTQDAARRQHGGLPGLLVLAGRQTSGRGRLGRAWADTSHLGVAATFVLAPDVQPGVLSLAAGVATAEACEACLGSAPGVLGLRWPNDVVDRSSGRKLAGVLIEGSGGLLLVGIGINVLHGTDDFSPDLSTRAISLAMLGSKATRLEVIERLVKSLDGAVRSEGLELADRFRARDVLRGRTASFTHDAEVVTGIVESVDPLGSLVVRAEGRTRTLPALTTSLVHDSVR